MFLVPARSLRTCLSNGWSIPGYAHGTLDEFANWALLRKKEAVLRGMLISKVPD